MSLGRKAAPRRVVPRLRVLDQYMGEWVAIKDDEVIAHSPDPLEVAEQLRTMGAAGRGAVFQRSATPTEALAVGLG